MIQIDRKYKYAWIGRILINWIWMPHMKQISFGWYDKDHEHPLWEWEYEK